MEGPQKASNFLEVWSHSEDFVDEIFDTNKAEFPQILFDDGVVGDGSSLLVDFGKSSLVDKFPDRLEIGISKSDVWLN